MSRVTTSLSALAAGRAGCVLLRKCRATGFLMGVYKAEEAGMDPDGGKWATVCEEHSTILNSDTRAGAEAAASWPDWCGECQVKLPDAGM